MKGSRLFLEIGTLDNANHKGKGNPGRNAELIKSRNEKLFHRYYYYSRLLQYKYENVLTQLMLEFDLSEKTVTNIIGSNATRMREIAKESLTRSALEKKFPHLRWDGKAVVLVKANRPNNGFTLS